MTGLGEVLWFVEGKLLIYLLCVISTTRLTSTDVILTGKGRKVVTNRLLGLIHEDLLGSMRPLHLIVEVLGEVRLPFMQRFHRFFPH